MGLSKTDQPALLLIDIQKGFEDLAYWGGERNNLDAEINAGILLNIWRANHLPIFHIKHCSTIPTSLLHELNKGNEFKEVVMPLIEEPVIKKNVNSAFIGTDLALQLINQKIKTLVIVGLTTDHCVSTTTRMAGNLGFETFVVSDATATFCKKGVEGQYFSADLIHETALASLQGEFATVVSTSFIKNTVEEGTI